VPESILKQLKVTVAEPTTAFDDCRARLIAELPPYADPGPMHASTCYVWPSSECPVGCGHCNYASPLSVGDVRGYSVARDTEPVIRVMNQMRLWKAVLSGGGEPMVEPDFCRAFVNRIDSPDLQEIELITSGHFAEDAAATADALRGLVDAWRTRGAELAKPRFTIRISLDWFHAQRIGVEPAARIIRLLGEEGLRDVGCYIRSVLLDKDDTIENLARQLGGELTPMTDYQQEIRLPDGRNILVYHKNLIVEGRMNQRKLARLPVALPAQSHADVFGKRFENTQGRSVPARTYNGPAVKHLEGLACLIEDDGKIRILEGNDPGRSPNVRQVSSWGEAITFLYADPITVFLVSHGPQELADLLADRYPSCRTLAADTNQLYHLVETLLSEPERRLYATLRVIEQHVTAGMTSAPAELLAEGYDLLDAARTGDSR
jgi:hypothetical protein